jgi:Stress responsive A/B Barrel Domain
MIAHVVLFKPRADLSADARSQLAASFEAALTKIPSIRRARLGRRLTHGRGYEALMSVDYQFAAVLEFDDEAGLKAYLEHPAHQRLGAQFFDAFEQALMYDFDLAEGTGALAEIMP